MTRKRWVIGSLFASLVCAVVGPSGAQGLTIQSFGGSGKLTFSRVPTATVYRVEWASSPAGPWTNFNGAAQQLDAIAQFASGSYTCSVPMVYRVVATVTNAPPVSPSGMVLIPGGSKRVTDPDEGFSYWLTVGSFYMDATEVTKAQWDVVYAWAVANGYGFEHAGSGKASNHPVHSVNWYDYMKWCNARSQQEGLTPCYTVSGSVYKTGQSLPACDFGASGYRLPTTKEWEYAARGVLNNARFPWGDTIDHTWANYKGDPSSYAYDLGYAGYDTRYATGETPYTSPAGAFAPNGYGLYDMAGNLWELCNDVPIEEPSIRGGAWNSFAADVRIVGYYYGGPTYAGNNFGVRTVRR